MVYACSLPDCTHYLPVKLAIGKKSICTECNEEMIMTHQIVTDLRLVNPRCTECRTLNPGKGGKKIISQETVNQHKLDEALLKLRERMKL